MYRGAIFLTILFIFTLYSLNAFAQIKRDIRLDSLENIIVNEKVPEVKVNGLIKLYESYKSIDTIKANNFYHLAISVAHENKLNKLIIRFIINEANINEAKFNFLLSLKKYMEALDLSIKSEDFRDQAYIYHKLSTIYRKRGNYNQAMVLALKSLKLSEGLIDSNGIQQCYLNIGDIHRYLHDYSKSIEYYMKSIEIAKRIGEKKGEARAYNNIGITFKELKKFDIALDYYEKAFKIFTSINDSFGIANYYGNSGILFLIRGNPEVAYSHFQKDLKIRLEIGDRRNEVSSYINFGDYYTYMQEYDSAMTNYQKGMIIAKKYGFPDKRLDVLLKARELNKKMGLFETAFNDYQDYNNLKDSLLNNTLSNEIARQEMSFLYEKEKLIREKDNQNKELRQIILFLGLSLIVFFIFILFLALRLRLKKQMQYSLQLKEEKNTIESDLFVKNKEFVAHSLYLAQKDEILINIAKDLRKNLSNENRKNAKHISQIINRIESCNNINIWDEFDVRFSQVDKEFYNNLTKKINTLSQNEKRLCAFLRLEMSTKEISIITGQTIHSINVARTRLRRKLGLLRNDQSISTFLHHI
ncbi:MAG: tetratricopeptide repeat protein [Bacteroidales bacterium]|nr:MAG: tetratricopeptide repeat protein [Bacteroidales bacterium]